MGCWCETCGITQLPINAGDKVRVFVIAMQKHYAFSEGGEGGGGTCYSNDRWAPIGPPIQGEYDDYGGVENIVMDDAAKIVEDRIRAGWVSLTPEHEWDRIPEKLELSDYLHFIERDRGKLKERGEQHLGLMFVLEDVYQAMVNFDSIEAHHTWPKDGKPGKYVYMPLSQGLKLEFKEFYENQLNLMKSRENSELDHLYELMADMGSDRIFSSYREDGLKIFKKMFQALAKEQLPWEHKKVQGLISQALEMLRFNIAMSSARKQWIPQSGKGGQQNELEIYQAITEAVQKVIEDRQAEAIADGAEEPDENGYFSYMIEHNKQEVEEEEEQDAKKGK